MIVEAQVFSLEIFTFCAGLGFGLCMIGWFAAWGIAKAVHFFKDMTR